MSDTPPPSYAPPPSVSYAELLVQVRALLECARLAGIDLSTLSLTGTEPPRSGLLKNAFKPGRRQTQQSLSSTSELKLLTIEEVHSEWGELERAFPLLDPPAEWLDERVGERRRLIATQSALLNRFENGALKGPRWLGAGPAKQRKWPDALERASHAVWEFDQRRYARLDDKESYERICERVHLSDSLDQTEKDNILREGVRIHGTWSSLSFGSPGTGSDRERFEKRLAASARYTIWYNTTSHRLGPEVASPAYQGLPQQENGQPPAYGASQMNAANNQRQASLGAGGARGVPAAISARTARRYNI